jgi:hypothetical protein
MSNPAEIRRYDSAGGQFEAFVPWHESRKRNSFVETRLCVEIRRESQADAGAVILHVVRATPIGFR